MNAGRKDLARQVTNLLGIIAGIALNGFVGQDVGTTSRRVEPMLSAAGWAFSIWGVIFAWTLAFGIWQALPAQRDNAVLRRIGVLPVVNAIGGGLWVLAFTHQQFLVAVALMLGILGSLIAIEIRSLGASGAAHWLVRAPFGLNLGWICVATVLNVAQTLHHFGYNGAPLTPLLWSMLVVVVAGVIGIAVVLRDQQRWTGVAVAWGLMGVFSNQRGVVDALAACALVVAVVVVASLAVSFSRRFAITMPRLARH